MTNATAFQQYRQGGEELSSPLPALLLEAEHLANTVQAGEHGRRRAGSGEDFWQYRPFGDGDFSAQIDWRRSARSADQLYVKQTEWQIASTAWLWCDPSASMDYSYSEETPSKRYRAYVLALALSYLLSRAGEHIGYPAKSPKIYRGRSAPESFGQFLTSQEEGEKHLPPFLPSAPRQHIVLMSDFLLSVEEIEKAKATFLNSSAQVHLVQILDPSEQDFPFEGRVEFHSSQSEEPLLFGQTNAISGDYKKLVAAHQSYLRDLCSHHGWTYQLHRTDMPAEQCLFALHAALSNQRQGG